MNRQIYEGLTRIVDLGRVKCDEPLKNHTTFRVGGPADFYVEVACTDELKEIITFLKGINVPFFILGKGSNLLVGDGGYEGVILYPGEGMSQVSCEGECIRAGAGATLAKVAAYALQNSLTGFEFAAGIPGTVGGAMVMNAGAYDGEMKQVVRTVTLIDEAGEELILSCDEMEFGYRTSILKRKSYIVTEVLFSLTKGAGKEIEDKMKELARRRMEKQPLEYSSAGSTFKRPYGNFAGKLIGEAGLSGFAIGGAKVSEKHNGFVINTGDATALQIRDLIKHIQKKVESESGILLEPEVIFVGRE